MATLVQSNLGTASSKSPGATLVIPVTIGHTAAKGNLVVVRAAAANASGTAPLISSVTDSQGNKYAILNTGGAQGGVITSGIVASLLDVALVGGTDNITVTWVSTPTAAVVGIADEFSGLDPILDGGGVFFNNGSSTTPRVPSAGTVTPLVGTVLFLCAVGTNGPGGDSYTEDGSASSGGDTWHSLSRTGTTGAGAGSNCTLAGAYKIMSSAVGQSWAPTITSRPWNVTDAIIQFSRPAYTSPLPPILAQ